MDLLTAPKTTAGRVLLPWQEAWRRDTSPMKIWEKSRRIGATYTEANDVVMTRLPGRPREHVDYWFSSADESAAYEFADYCRHWLEVAGAVADRFTEQVDDPQTGRAGTAFCVRFPGGARMTAMSSNPRRFRSKGGDIGLDEFAYHDQAVAMYEAAEPCTMWGGWMRMLSTHNGEGSEFNRHVQMGHRHAAGQARPDDIPWSIHRITLPEAVEQGLVERINATQGTRFGRQEFLDERRRRCRSEDHWRQEYLAIPSIDTTAWLPYDLLAACESDQAGVESAIGDGQLYVGMDVGETDDRTVIWVLERVGDVLWTRAVIVFRGELLAVKEGALLRWLGRPKAVRACVDGTGVGAQIGQAAERTGKGESVKFTLAVKDELASPLRRLFEDRRIRIPADREIRDDLHSVRMTQTASGHPRFDAERDDSGHADRFWALALAVHAASTGTTFRLTVG
ncbi:MAG: hypothetical protein GX591_11925 [Planctomycetes bacterium]|nr:hypothetical protein [Planctomycetota bacterium]